MNRQTFTDLASLLRVGRPDDALVAHSAEGPVTWRTFAARVEAAAHAEDTAQNGKPRKRREPPGEDLTRYDQAPAPVSPDGAATRRGRFTRYVPRRWRTDPHGDAARWGRP